MKLEFVPLLQLQRDIYKMPRNIARFKSYLDLLTGGTDDMALPLPAMNPMGKEHVGVQLDTLIALEAEKVAEEATHEAQQRLFGSPEADQHTLKVALVVADDAHGAWTNRYLTETRHFFQNKGEIRRNWATVLLWTGDTYTSQSQIRREVLVTIYRVLYLKRHGLPTTLQQMMRQEGLALAFAGAIEPYLDADDLAYTREVIQPYLDSEHFPTIFACLYGDEAAKSVGYEPLGLSTNWGLKARNSAEFNVTQDRRWY